MHYIGQIQELEVEEQLQLKMEVWLISDSHVSSLHKIFIDRMKIVRYSLCFSNLETEKEPGQLNRLKFIDLKSVAWTLYCIHAVSACRL